MLLEKPRRSLQGCSLQAIEAVPARQPLGENRGDLRLPFAAWPGIESCNLGFVPATFFGRPRTIIGREDPFELFGGGSHCRGAAGSHRNYKRLGADDCATA